MGGAKNEEENETPNCKGKAAAKAKRKADGTDISSSPRKFFADDVAEEEGDSSPSKKKAARKAKKARADPEDDEEEVKIKDEPNEAGGLMETLELDKLEE